jgi:hypothetical protein
VRLLCVALALLLAGAASAAAARPRVTVITDSVAGALYWAADARILLGDGLDLRLEVKTCRKLVDPGCPAYGERPESVLDLVERRGPAIGQVAVVAVGDNDRPGEYADGLDGVMRALRAAGVARVVWVMLEELRDP